MSRLLVVRHAQASFGSADYDQLSDLGRDQARHLADHWSTRRETFNALVSGPCRRHHQTLTELTDRLALRGVRCPEVWEIPEFAEHAVDQLIVHQLKTLTGLGAGMARLCEAWQSSIDTAQHPIAFQRLFEATALHWISGQTFQNAIESYDHFQQRVGRGLDRIVQHAPAGSCTVVCTSVGPSAIMLQRALGCAPELAAQTSWRLFNAAVSRFVFSGQRFTLDGFNDVAHLPPDQLTYR